MPEEVELKLEVSPAVARKFLGSRWLKNLATAPAKNEKLVSVYYDTDDFALRDRHAALRIRKTGDRHIQTVKLEDSGSPLGRIEWECDVEGLRPDLRKAKKTDLGRVQLAKFNDALKPIFETAVTRTAITVRYEGSDLEIAVDVGQVKTGRNRQPIHEIELELKGGDTAAVAGLGAEIAGQLRAAYGAISKAERGYALREGKAKDAVHASTLVLKRMLPASDAFKITGLSCVHHFAANHLAVLAGKPEGIHQMRIGLRRLRAAISVFKEMLRDPATEAIKGELKWLGKELGPARDMGVLIDGTLAALEKKTPETEAVRALKRDIVAKRAGGFKRAKAAVKSERYRALVLNTVFWLIAGKWTTAGIELIEARRRQEVENFAGRELARRNRNVVRQLGKLKKLNARERHELRIAVKKLRYATEFFESLFEGHASHARRKALSNVLKALQSCLGELNDMRVHGKLARDIANADSPTGEMAREAFVMGLIAGEERAKSRRLISDAAKAGKKMATLKPFWQT